MLVVKAIKSILIESNSFLNRKTEQSKACSSSSQNNTPIETEKDNEPTVANCQYQDYAKRLSKAKN